jgi:hypothetical protein
MRVKGVRVALVEMTADAWQAIPPTDFAAEGIWERRDLQRLPRDNIAAVDESLLVIAEELGDFEGSDRRVDLLPGCRSCRCRRRSSRRLPFAHGAVTTLSGEVQRHDTVTNRLRV